MSRRVIVAAALLGAGLTALTLGIRVVGPDPKVAVPPKVAPLVTSDRDRLTAVLREAQTIEEKHIAATGSAKYDSNEVWLPGLHTPEGAQVSLFTKGRWYCIRGELNGLVLYLRSDPEGITAVAC